MKREERNMFNDLRRNVSVNTINVGVPVSYSTEARQALHEMLTIEKHMNAKQIEWNDIIKCYVIGYYPGSKPEQENADINKLMSTLLKTDYTWNGYKKPEETETAETTNTKKEGEKKMKNTNKETAKKADNKGYDLSKLAEAYHMTLEMNGTNVPFHSPRGNNKLGSIPAFNLLPVVTCSAEACRTCGKGGCYAVKNCLCHGYDISKNNTLRAWTHNTILALHDIRRLEIELERYFSSVTSPRYFRIHSSGDFKTVEYAYMWFRIAQKHPETQFLAFTKQWDVIREVPFYTLPNFSMVLSGWEGVTIPEDLEKLYPVALCVEEIPENVPDNCFVCPGDCEHCAMCWKLAKFGLYVIFKKH